MSVSVICELILSVKSVKQVDTIPAKVSTMLKVLQTSLTTVSYEMA